MSKTKNGCLVFSFQQLWIWGNFRNDVCLLMPFDATWYANHVTLVMPPHKLTWLCLDIGFHSKQLFSMWTGGDVSAELRWLKCMLDHRSGIAMWTRPTYRVMCLLNVVNWDIVAWLVTSCLAVDVRCVEKLPSCYVSHDHLGVVHHVSTG